MKKFEYSIDDHTSYYYCDYDNDSDLVYKLNLLGLEGWEVVSIIAFKDGNSTSYKIFSKRERE